MAPLKATRLVVWGHGHSWLVLQVDEDGRTLWRSEWFRSRAEAERRAALFVPGPPDSAQTRIG